MASNAVVAVGTQLQRGDGAAPEVFTKIDEVRNLAGPGQTAESADVTSLDSTGGYREFKPTFKDPGELTFTINFIPSVRGGLYADFLANTVSNYKIVYPDTPGTIMSFAAAVTGFTQGATIEDVLTADVTLKLSGEATFNN